LMEMWRAVIIPTFVSRKRFSHQKIFSSWLQW